MISLYFAFACTTDDSIGSKANRKNIVVDIPEIFLDESIVEEIEMI